MRFQELLNRARDGEVIGNGLEQIEALQIELDSAIKAVHREQRYSRKLEADAERYRKLRPLLQFELGGYNGPNVIEDATESEWRLVTESIFEGTNAAPESIDAAVDALPNPEQECQP